MPPLPTVTALKRQFDKHNLQAAREFAPGFTLGAIAIDQVLGGFSYGALHEVLPDKLQDSAAATGFALALVQRSAVKGTLLWIRQEEVDAKTGQLYAPGMVEVGLDPTRVVLVRARDAADALYAAEEGARCPAVAMVLLETWKRPEALNLTATRRLAFAAGKSGVTILLLRRGTEPEPSVAETRWLIRSVASRALEANAPGFPAFHLTLLRHRRGIIGLDWKLEWKRDRQCFEEWSPLPSPVVAFTANRPVARLWKEAAIRQFG